MPPKSEWASKARQQQQAAELWAVVTVTRGSGTAVEVYGALGTGEQRMANKRVIASFEYEGEDPGLGAMLATLIGALTAVERRRTTRVPEEG